MGGCLTPEDIKFILLIYPFLNINTAIETGTYKGESSRLLSKFFKHVHTFEIHKPLYDKAVQDSKHIDNITFHYGDSVKLLPNILNTINGSVLYFIDAHTAGTGTGWNGDELVPLLTELRLILKLKKDMSVFIFDDVRLFNKYDDWKAITTETIKKEFRNVIYDVIYNDRYYVIGN